MLDRSVEVSTLDYKTLPSDDDTKARTLGFVTDCKSAPEGTCYKTWFKSVCPKTWRESCESKGCTEDDGTTQCPAFISLACVGVCQKDAAREMKWFAHFSRAAVSAAVLRGGGLVDLVVTDSVTVSAGDCEDDNARLEREKRLAFPSGDYDDVSDCAAVKAKGWCTVEAKTETVFGKRLPKQKCAALKTWCPKTCDLCAPKGYDPTTPSAAWPTGAPPITIVLNVGTKQKHKWMRLADAQSDKTDAALYGQLRALPKNRSGRSRKMRAASTGAAPTASTSSSSPATSSPSS